MNVLYEFLKGVPTCAACGCYIFGSEVKVDGVLKHKKCHEDYQKHLAYMLTRDPHAPKPKLFFG